MCLFVCWLLVWTCKNSSIDETHIFFSQYFCYCWICILILFCRTIFVFFLNYVQQLQIISNGNTIQQKSVLLLLTKIISCTWKNYKKKKKRQQVHNDVQIHVNEYRVQSKPTLLKMGSEITAINNSPEIGLNKHVHLNYHYAPKSVTLYRLDLGASKLFRLVTACTRQCFFSCKFSHVQRKCVISFIH